MCSASRGPYAIAELLVSFVDYFNKKLRRCVARSTGYKQM